MLEHRNTGWEAVQFVAFVASIVAVVVGGARLFRWGMRREGGRLKWLLPLWTLFGNACTSFFRYPASVVLVVVCLLAGLGLLLPSLGVKSWLFPEHVWGRFCTAALLLLLYSEVILLSYLRDQEVFRSLRETEGTFAWGSKPYQRTRRVLEDTHNRLQAPDWWLRIAASRTLAIRKRAVAWAWKSTPPEGGAEISTPGAQLEGDHARLKAVATLVLVHTWYALLAIAVIAVVVVVLENLAYLGSAAGLLAMSWSLVGYVLGLLTGWRIAVGVFWLVDRFVLRAERRQEPTPWPLPAGLRFFSGSAALSFLVLSGLVPWLRPLWAVPSVLVAAGVCWLRGRKSMPLSWAPRADGYWTYPLGMLALLVLLGAAITVCRGLGIPDEGVWLFFVILGGYGTILYARRTRLLTPGSLVAVPASFLLAYLLCCVVYGAYFQGVGVPGSWSVMALPLTVFLGAAVALYFCFCTILPRFHLLGLAAILGWFAYMNGMAVDLPYSAQKSTFEAMSEYQVCPVRLDSRDYLMGSYGMVVPLDERALPEPNRGWGTKPARISTRIGGGWFVVPSAEEDQGNLYVGLPTGYLVPELMKRESYRVILRMPKRVKLVRRQGESDFEILPEAEGGVPVSWENLQNSALLWVIPKQKPESSLATIGNEGRYAVFPMRSKQEKPSVADRTPYWAYEARVPGDLNSGWRITPPTPASSDGVGPEHLYLIGNWGFPIEPLEGGGRRVPEEMRPIIKSDRPLRLAWFRVQGAAQSPYYPRLWRPEGSRANRPDSPRSNGGFGLRLNLEEPRVRGVSLQDDLELTLALPRPWGNARVVGSDRSSGRHWVLATMMNRWVLPSPGDRLRFAGDSRPREEGGLSADLSYRVVSVSKPRWGEGAPPIRDIATKGRNDEEGSGVESSYSPIFEPNDDGGVPRWATLLELVEASEDFLGKDSEEGEANVVPPPAAASEIPLVPPSLWETTRLSWKLEPPEKVGTVKAPEAPLLDQIHVLEHWKATLDYLRRRVPLTLEGSEETPIACRCPVEHVSDCPHAQGEASCDCPVKHKLVLVTTNGGGIRSALWAVTVLETLERQFGPMFPYHVRLITGASGGMVGASYYTESIPEPPLDDPSQLRPDPRGLAAKLGSVDFLSQTANHLVFSDLPRNILSPTSVREDRGVALERAWRAIDETAKRGYGRTFQELRAEEAEGWRPSLVFTPMLVEDGRRLLISNLDFNSIPRNLGGMLLESNSSLLRPQMSQLGVVMPLPTVGEDLYSLSSVEFFRVFPAADDLTVGTAARMSATFPVITPISTLPTTPPRSVVDAGFYDNFGVNLASLWARQGSVRDWLIRNTSGVVLIQIRDHTSQTVRTELDAEVRRVGGIRPWNAGESRLASLSGDVIGALSLRSFPRLWGPLISFINSRYAVNTFRNDEQIEDLDNTLNVTLMAAKALRKELQQWIQEAREEVNPDSSGFVGTFLDRLRAQKERMSELGIWEDLLGEQAPRTERVPSEFLETLPDRVRINRYPFPYSTVVFECPVEAVLSRDLSDFESENIRMGMGPLFEQEEDRAKAPLSLLTYDPLSDAQRHDLLGFLSRELTSSESKKYGPMVGASRIVAVAGIWRNLQRLKLLESWWTSAKP